MRLYDIIVLTAEEVDSLEDATVSRPTTAEEVMREATDGKVLATPAVRRLALENNVRNIQVFSC